MMYFILLLNMWAQSEKFWNETSQHRSDYLFTKSLTSICIF